MSNFCTLFNSKYLTRGLAMYRSLEKHTRDFHLFIFAFDDNCFSALKQLNLRKATIIPLVQFEDTEMSAVKANCQESEYCWIFTPAIIRYAIKTYGLKECTYLSPDLLFFSNPRTLYDGMGDKAVLISPHDYTEKHGQPCVRKIYSVQFVCFKNSAEGMAILDWWQNACLQYCFECDDQAVVQQGYDSWTTQFDCVLIWEHTGCGLAPWNIQHYNLEYRNDRIWGRSVGGHFVFPVIFYHYHAFGIAEANSFIPLPDGLYDLNENILSVVYRPYMQALLEANNDLRKKGVKTLGHENIRIPRIRKSVRSMFKLYFKGKFREFYHINYFRMKWFTKLI